MTIEEYQPSKGESVLVKYTDQTKWYKRTFVGWQGPYPLTIMEKNGEYVREGASLLLELWDDIKQFRV